MNVRFDAKIDLPLMGRAASVRPESLNNEARTVEVVWTTGAQVRRYSWFRDEEFDEALVVDSGAIRLDRLNGGAPFLDSHRGYGLDSVLGVVVDGSVRIEGGKGYATIRFSERAEVDPVWRDIKDGIIRNVSVGYRIHKMERIAKDDRKDGGERALYRAIDWEPLEISAVAIPADPGAQTRSADRQQAAYPCIFVRNSRPDDRGQNLKGNDMNIRTNPAEIDLTARAAKVVKKSGLPDEFAEELATRDGMTAERLDALAPSLQLIGRYIKDDDPSGMSQRAFIDDFLDQVSDLSSRAAITDACRTAVLDYQADHDPLGGRLSIPPSPYSSHQRMANMLDAVEDGMFARVNPNHKPTIGREFAGMTFAETAAAIRAAKGLPPITGGPGAIIDVELGLQQRAVGHHATGDFPAALGNVANKSLLAHYQAAQSALLRLSRRRQAADFKPISNIRLGGSLGLDKVPESAEYTYGTISESSEKFVIATYGKIIALTRQLLINDDLGAFNDFTRIQGHGAAETEAKLMVGLLEANSGAGPTLADENPVFHASRGNIATGAAPSIAAVSAMQTILRRQKGLEGEAIHVVPFAIVVPPELETEALQVVAALYPQDTASANPFSGRLEVLVEPRLQSAQSWYLTAAPGQPDSLQHAYLASEPGPQFMSRVGWEVDGIEFKCRLDFGAGFVDWRGWVRNPGA